MTDSNRLKALINFLTSEQKVRNQEDFSVITGINKSTLSELCSGKREITERYVHRIQTKFPEINFSWLLTGEGQMLEITTPSGIPFYENLPVSAGQADLIHITQGEHPTGYISLPGVRAIAAFPVVGCSMEPEIKPGDFIAVTPMDNLEAIDPDKTYMIITHDDRMIKHLHPDIDDSDILWASSPNYPKFRLRKSDITALYRINFHGRIL